MPLHRLHGFFGVIASCFILSACATGPDVDIVIHSSQQGAVTLERIQDRSFQAAHPIQLPPETIAQVLRGLLVKPAQRILQTLIGGEPDATRVFTEADVRYLSPLLVEGLVRAAPDQQVGFSVSQLDTSRDSNEAETLSAPGESISGSLYAYGRSLYVTLNRIRPPRERGSSRPMTNRGNLDRSGLADHVVDFVPKSALRPDSYRDARSTKSTMIIDYELLASAPINPQAPPVRSIPLKAGAEADGAPGAPRTRDDEIESLRQEIREIKKRLIEQEAEQSGERSSAPILPQ